MTRKTTSAVYIILTLLALTIVSPQDGDAHAQLGLPSVPGGLRDLPADITVDRRIRSRAERAAEKAEREAAEAAEATDDAGYADGLSLDEAQEVIDETGTRALGRAALARKFVRATDTRGAPVEADIIVVLADTEERDRLRQAGYRAVAERELESLGVSMLTLRRPDGQSMAAALDTLRDAHPDAAVDYNHVYRFDSAAEPGPAATAPDDAADLDQGPRLRIGIIDSAVMPAHRGLEGSRVIAKDFVANDGERPLTHGTAVASLVARSAGNSADLYAASVFFVLPGHAPGATTESLVAALDWLAAERVDAVNMSLSGPGNELLEAAVAALYEQGRVVIAAVGNNGPGGEPLYPAAYDNVIGVTAVDRNRRVFRNANRGEHVDYAALGVNVKVADSDTGGWRLASGTSMASPHVAVVVAKTLSDGGVEARALMSWLMASAEDLGRRGFDPVYGHGLITEPPVVVSGN